MLHSLLSAWRARRVLLVGGPDRMTLFMQALLCELGAKPARLAPDAGRETLNRALTQGRIGALIVPDAGELSGGCALDRLAALDALLDECREAGTPLSILLSGESVYRADGRPLAAQENDPIGGETPQGFAQSMLDLYACGVSRGLCGDPVNTICVRHLPCLGCGHPVVAPYDAWCAAAASDLPLDVPSPGMPGVFIHPLDICFGALLLGARYLLGDTDCTGAFNLGAGSDNLVPNRTAALRFTRRLGVTKPMRETEPPHTAILPFPDGARARLLCGARCRISGEEALMQLFSLEKSSRAGFEAQLQEIHAQTQAYLASLGAK